MEFGVVGDLSARFFEVKIDGDSRLFFCGFWFCIDGFRWWVGAKTHDDDEDDFREGVRCERERARLVGLVCRSRSCQPASQLRQCQSRQSVFWKGSARAERCYSRVISESFTNTPSHQYAEGERVFN